MNRKFITIRSISPHNRSYQPKELDKMMAWLNWTCQSRDKRTRYKRLIIRKRSHTVLASSTCSWVKRSNSRRQRLLFLRVVLSMAQVAVSQHTLLTWIMTVKTLLKEIHSKHWRRIPNQLANWSYLVCTIRRALATGLYTRRSLQLCHQRIANSMSLSQHRPQVRKWRS